MAQEFYFYKRYGKTLRVPKGYKKPIETDDGYFDAITNTNYPTEKELDEARAEAAELNRQENKLDEYKRQQDKFQKAQKLQKEIEDWNRILNDQYASPYLKEQASKKLPKLKQKLENLK